MEWMEIFIQFMQLVLLPLLGALTTFLVVLIKRKGDEIAAKTDNELQAKYIKMLTTTIADCVDATSQTYVESLKKQGAFDAEAQKKAFEMSYNAVFRVLTEDAKEYLSAVYGDLEAYVTQRIEAQVKAGKAE